MNAVSPLGETLMAAANRPLLAAQAANRRVALPESLPPPELSAPLVAYLLSDAGAGVTGQKVRIAGGDLSLVSHPGIAEPVLRRDSWTVEDIAEAFRATLRERQFRSGLARLEVKAL